MKQYKNTILTNSFFVALTASFCCALWGSATPMIKIGSSYMIPDGSTASTMLFAGIRFFLAGAMVVLFGSIIRRKALVPKARNIGKVIWVAMFQTVIQYVLFYIGVANTTAVKATISSGCGSFSAILVATLLFRFETLTPKKIFACLLGFLGIVFVHFDGMDFQMNFSGDGFVLLATVAYGVSSSLMKQYSDIEDPVVISGYQFLIGGLIMALIGLLFGGDIVLVDIFSWAILLYLAFLSAAAYSIWGILLKYNPLSKVAIYGFMIPVFGVMISQWVLSEQGGVPLWRLCGALALVSVGIFLLNYSATKKQSL